MFHSLVSGNGQVASETDAEMLSAGFKLLDTSIQNYYITKDAIGKLEAEQFENLKSVTQKLQLATTIISTSAHMDTPPHDCSVDDYARFVTACLQQITDRAASLPPKPLLTAQDIINLDDLTDKFRDIAAGPPRQGTTGL